MKATNTASDGFCASRISELRQRLVVLVFFERSTYGGSAVLGGRQQRKLMEAARIAARCTPRAACHSLLHVEEIPPLGADGLGD